jgi:hypothetical protein
MLNQPSWITQDITPYDIAAILQGGCESGAYMPAVTYYDACKTMAEYGQEVLMYIEDIFGVGEAVPSADSSWLQINVYYLSLAVELWVSANESIADWDNDEEEISA